MTEATYPTPTLDQILIWYREFEQGGLYNAESHHSWTGYGTTADTATATVTTTKGGSIRFPRIVIRDNKGKELDTESVYQNAIYEAKWKLAQGEPPKFPEEWRLPHVQCPARPDYSRGPPPGRSNFIQRQSRRKKRRRRGHSRAHTWANESLKAHELETVTFPGSLSFQSLTSLPSLTPVLTDPDKPPVKGYLSIVESVKYFNKELTETEHRETEYTAPSYCTGCHRTELCYGCTKCTTWHYHQDKPMRTGGGFTYWKRDLPTASNKLRADKHGVSSEPPENVFYHGAKFPDLDKYGVAVKVSKVVEGHKKVPPATPEAIEIPRVDEDLVQYKIKKDKPREKLYKAPEPFKLKKTERLVTKAEDPFSTDRQFDLNHGDGIKIKKSDKLLTEFVDFPKLDVDYQEPEPFKLKKREAEEPKTVQTEEPADEPQPPPEREVTPIKSITPIELTSPPSEPESELQHAEILDDEFSISDDSEIQQLEELFQEEEKSPGIVPPGSPDSGVESSPVADSGQSTPIPEYVREPTPVKKIASPPPKLKTPPPKVQESPVVEKPKVEIRKVETPKKRVQPPPLPPRKQREPGRKTVPKTPTPIPPPKEKTPSPPPKLATPEPSPTPSPPTSPTPEPSKEPSPLLEEEESYIRVEDTPEQVDPEDLLPPPKVKSPTKLKKFIQKKVLRKKPAVIPEPQPVQPITWKELKEINDPLDYLAKYCIIHPDRLPYYERVFHNTVNKQDKRYAHVPASWDDTKANDETVDENRMTTPDPNDILFRELKLISKAEDFDQDFGIVHGACDVLVDKSDWTVEEMGQKYEELESRINELEIDRKRFILNIIREKFPQLLKYDYEPFTKKGKKKKEKQAGLVTEIDDKKALSIEDIIARLDPKMWNNVKQDGEVNIMEAEIKICEEKLAALTERMKKTKVEKKVLEFCSRDEYMDNHLEGIRSPDFRRRQSTLYQRTHPVPDVEINIEELENALQTINGQLVTDREYSFIYNILDLPGKKRLSMKLFSAVAALSEKVKQLDPFLKKIINKFDFEALDVKMSKSKELYFLLNSKDNELPDDKVTAQSLAVELAAGGMTPDHVQYVVNKFNREKGGYIEFLDFLTYVPLFIEIHSRIVQDPLNEVRDL